jgi:hypothetical protein
MPVWKQRRGTAAALAAANETPAEGQIVFEIDTNRLKVGNGATAYNSLQYIGTIVGISSVTGLQAALDGKQAAGSYALQSSLDGKAALSHTHTVSAITDAGTAATFNVPAVGNATTTQVVIGSDTRLTDQRAPTDGSVTSTKLSSTLVIDCGVVS